MREPAGAGDGDPPPGAPGSVDAAGEGWEIRSPGVAPALDPADPRLTDVPPEAAPEAARRRLVPSGGPGGSPQDPYARVLRVAIPVLFFAGLAAVAGVFAAGLSPLPQEWVVGDESAVRAAVAERPRRVCLRDNNPCAWLTVVDGRLAAFNTSGPLPQEYGRQGVGWCPSSRWFAANATGSRYDSNGRVLRGPAQRGLDRFAVRVGGGGLVVVDFAQLTAGLQAQLTTDTTPAAGPDCDVVPFDRDADLRL